AADRGQGERTAAAPRRGARGDGGGTGRQAEERSGGSVTTLLIADHDNSTLKEPTARALTAALELGAELHLLDAGKDCNPAAETATRLAGVAKVLLANAESLAHQLPETVARLVVGLAGPYDVLAAPATAAGKTVMPRIAALLDTMQVSEVIRIVAPDTFERP